MDPRLQASFIPKKTLMEHSSAPVKPPRTISLFSIVSWLIFIVSVCLALGVFLYNLYLNSTITNLTNTINTTEQEYAASSATLATYSRMDDRLKTATELLDNHIAASPIFAFLEQNTAQNVQLNSFTFALESSDDTDSGSGATAADSDSTDSTGSDDGMSNTVGVTLTGQAKTLNSLGVQANVYSSNPLVQNPIVSDIAEGLTGEVTFSLSADINPDILTYASVLPPGSTGVGTTTASTTASSAVSVSAASAPATPASASVFPSTTQ